MNPIDELPIPEWGLTCPFCGVSLSGATSYACFHCGESFDVRRLLARHRPIADLGLECPNCEYSLTGLTGSRCPECGVQFSLAEMLEDSAPAGGLNLFLQEWPSPADAHLKRREPTFTGLERPFPDFGLTCVRCDRPLAGVTGNACRVCGERFELADLCGARDWIKINRYIPRTLAASARAFLYEARIPFLVDNAGLHGVYGGRMPFIGGALRVPREFFFDALFTIRQADRPPAEFARHPWTCEFCGVHVPANFEICWNCERLHPSAQAEGQSGEED